MDEGKGWLRTHWRTAAVLLLIFSLALFLRVYFVTGLAFNVPNVACDAIYTPPFSGGSDSFYWDRALCHSFQTGRDVGADPMLNYPVGLQNPRPPLFPWFSLLVGRLLAPLFANAWQAVLYTFLVSTGLFGALTIFPTYALGKEAFGRKAGIIAAFLLAVSVGHLQRSPSTNADHDAFTLFFVVSTFYFYLRALRTLNRRRWVENWSQRAAIAAGVRAFLRENRTSLLYALFAGLCVAVIALAWQGWAYVAVILMVWFAVELFLDRFRNEDTLGTWILFAIALATPLVLALPWYATRNQIRVWFDVPAYLYLASLVLGLAFTVTRDYPWTLVIPSTLAAAAAGLGVGVFVNPALANAFFTGAGYFIQSKVVTTIAEDQAPGMSQIILSFGLFTFGLSLAAIAYLLWQVPRRRDPGYNIVVVWAFAAIFMAITAARFIFNASPAFAIVSGFAVDQILVRADFATMRRTYRSLAEGSWRNAIRKSLKVRHVLAVLALVFLILLPNVWWAVDASIPFEMKTQYDRQVASLLPTFLRSPGYNPASGQPFYFGAFGYNIPRSTQYYPAAWEWFAAQDRDKPPELRPAYLSWWDYGFEAVDRGAHPTVADNFQSGFQFAGQFITTGDETEAVALLAIRVMEGDIRHHRSNFSPSVERILQGSGLPVDSVRAAFLRSADFIPIVQADVVRYGPWAADMQPQNAMYIYLRDLVTRTLDAEEIVSLYGALRRATGSEIGYFAVDARLFPISAQNTGIFYAPVKLADHRVIDLPDGRVLPFEFFQIIASTNRGDVPIQEVGPADVVQSQRIEYQPAFYESMFYRAYVGYSPNDLGVDDRGIPGFSQALSAFPPTPAWNLSHFRVAYRTAYYNPFPDPANHTDAWRAVNYDEAQRLQANITAGTIEGVVDLSPQATLTNGVVFLRYYDGAWVNGTLSAGASPLAGVRVTVTDELGTPHYVTVTDERGRYSTLVPYGDITLRASVGAANPSTLVGARTLASTTIQVTLDQAMRTPADADGDTVPDWILTRDLAVEAQAAQGTAYFDLNRDVTFGEGDLRAVGAVITLSHRDFDFRRTATATAAGTFSIPDLPPGTYAVSIELSGRTLEGGDVTLGTGSEDVRVPFAIVQGTTTSTGGEVVPAADVEVRDATNGTVIAAMSEGNGTYRVGPLLAGNYTATATAGDLASSPARFRVGAADLSLNLVLVPSGTVSGRTTLFGIPRPFATLEFRAASDPGTARTVTADGESRYAIRLAAGEWFVTGRFYDSTHLYALLGRVVVAPGSAATFNALFVDGARVEGRVRDANPAITNPQADVAFANAAGQLWLRTDPQGSYLGFLPTGTYDLQAFNSAGAFFASTSLPAGARRDIALAATSETVPWRVYRDENRNGALDPGEDVEGARVDLRDDRGARVFLTMPAEGGLPIPLFANRTYSGSVSAPGYGTRSIPVSSPTAMRALLPIALVPTQIAVQGSVLLDGSALMDRPVTIIAAPIASGAVAASTVSNSAGGYRLDLAPGLYDLIVDENVSTSHDQRYQSLDADRIDVAVGQGTLAHNVRIVIRHRVEGEVTLSGNPVSAVLRFDGPDERLVNATATGYAVYLRPGSYVVIGNRTIAPRDYAFVSGAIVPTTGNLSFDLVNATRVTGRVLFGGAAVAGPMPVTFVREGGGDVSVSTTPAGDYAVILPPGDYFVSLDGTSTATEGGVTRFYRHTFAGDLAIPPDRPTLAFDLATARTLDNTTLSGNATMGGVGVGASIAFMSRGGGAITSQTTAAADGAYSVSLAPGSYDVHARRTAGSGALLARIVVPHAASFHRDLSLATAFLLSGITTNAQGSAISVPVTIQASARLELTSDSAGGFSAPLPFGTYVVTATRTGTERGISVTYRATTSVTLEGDTVTNLRLTKEVVRSAQVTWDETQRKTVSAGGTVAYTIAVRNTGNVDDTFLFSGTPADWRFAFTPASVSLSFGTSGSSTVVQVFIETPSNALVEHGGLQIVTRSATEGSTVGSVAVSVDIARVRGLTVSPDAAGAVFEGKRLEYVLLVVNTGNAPETVELAILNPGDLAAFGWSVHLSAPDGSRTETVLRDLTVPANQTLRVPLRAQSANAAGGAAVVVRVSAQDSNAVAATSVFTLQLPDLAAGGLTVTGPDISRIAPADLLWPAIAISVAAAVALGFALSRRRR